ncbi:MAG: nucleoside-diphosphate-sugar epimerase [Bradymonadia bacterium]|jgi:nucleoside-diphosphate-sugar epimerase
MTHVIVTGASGTVGTRVTAELTRLGCSFSTYTHRDKPDMCDWGRATHVINCAAVVPCPGMDSGHYWAGNVAFLERLMPFWADKHVVHFGTTSTLYRVHAYQVSKGVGETLLRTNEAHFASLTIVPLPTLADEGLITMLAEKASAAQAEGTDPPTVSRLRYGFCTPAEVARHAVEDLVLGDGGTLSVEARDLYEQVRARTDAPINEGAVQDRTCERERWAVTNDEALATFLALFDEA